jgi:hypothetical protein
VFGQAFFPRGREFQLGLAAGLVLSLLVTGCAGPLSEGLRSGPSVPWGGPEGRWLGPVGPVEAGCGPRTTGLMSIGRDIFAFDPFQSTSVLHGKIGLAGDLVGEAAQPVAESKSVALGFVGQLQQSNGAEEIIGTLTSGRCHWAVALFRG